MTEHLSNATKACKLVSTSCDGYYRIKELYETGGESAMVEVSRRRPIMKNPVACGIEESVVKGL